VWLKLTVEPFPRLSLVRRVLADGAGYLGPFNTARTAEQAMAALHEALPLRQCTARVSPRHPTSACALFEMGRCNAPCEGRESIEAYAVHVDTARTAFTADPRPVVAALSRRIGLLADAERYEDAAQARDRLAAFLRTAARMQRLSALAGCAEMVAARPATDGGWELAVIRYGRLAGAAVVRRGVDPRPTVRSAQETAEVVLPGVGCTPAATAEETECILRWLDQPGTRLVELDGVWSCPTHGAGGLAEFVRQAADARTEATPFDDRRGLTPAHRPAAFG
jgi:DNA polymerase-3 subunit epsilon